MPSISNHDKVKILLRVMRYKSLLSNNQSHACRTVCWTKQIEWDLILENFWAGLQCFYSDFRVETFLYLSKVSSQIWHQQTCDKVVSSNF